MPEDKIRNILYFNLWIEEQGASCRLGRKGVICVLSIDHIEPDHWAALYAQQTPKGVVVVEMTNHFPTSKDAWQAVEDPFSPTEPPRLFQDWVKEQYLTDRQARVEHFDLDQ